MSVRGKKSTVQRVNKFARIDRAINKIARRVGPRRRMNLGPMGPLGDNIIISIDITQAYRQFLKLTKSGAGKGLGLQGLETEQKVYGSIWLKMMFDLIQFTFKRIDLNVPKMTGDLRKSMKDSVKVPASGTFPMVMVVNPNKPSTRKKGGVRYQLFDPTAKKGWFQLTQLQCQNEAKKRWEQYIRTVWIPIFKQLGVKNPRGEAGKLFKIRPTRLKF
jgi:hypothetical protein